MRKHTTLDLDQSLVREASTVLGTSRTTDTVHAALAEVVARRRRAELVRMDFPDLTPEVVEEMRAVRGYEGNRRAPTARRHPVVRPRDAP